jgi:predicted PurR-regulated permease PerM
MSSPIHFEPKLTFFQELGLVLKNFIQGQFLIALCNAIVAGSAFWIMGINHALLLGAFVGLMSFIPYLGPMLGFLPAMIMAWITHHNLWYILGVMAVWALIQVLESLVFQPKILGNKLKIHPLLVILSFVVWGAWLGIVGVLLAVPLTAILQIIIRRIHARVKQGRS